MLSAVPLTLQKRPFTKLSISIYITATSIKYDSGYVMKLLDSSFRLEYFFFFATVLSTRPNITFSSVQIHTP